MFAHKFASFATNQVHNVIKVYFESRLEGKLQPPQLNDLRMKAPPGVTVEFTNARAEIEIAVLVRSEPPPHTNINVSDDPTLPRAKITCPRCEIEDDCIFSGGWSSSLGAGKKGYNLWSQCKGCKITFNMHEDPVFSEESFFESVPCGPEVLQRAINVWQKDGNFSCFGDLTITQPGGGDSIVHKDAPASDLCKLARAMVPEIF